MRWDPASLREGYDELLAWPLFTHQRTRWQSRREYLDYMALCRNDEFTFDGISVRLPEIPSREELLAKATAMFARTRSLDDIVDRAHAILLAAVGMQLAASGAGRA